MGKARLVVESGMDEGLVVPIPDGKTSLGRSANNDCQIIDRRMSRHHVEFLKDGNELILCDLGSKNGTYLNEEKVQGRNLLKNIDRIRIGETVLRVEIIVEEEPEPAPVPVSNTTQDVSYEDPQWLNTAAKQKKMAAALEPGNLSELTRPLPSQGAPMPKAAKVEQPAQQSEFGSAAVASDGAQGGAKARQLEIMFAVADAIRTVLDLDELLEQIMEIVGESLDPDRGILFLTDEQTNRLYSVISREAVRSDVGKKEEWREPENPLAVSQTILNEAIDQQVCILMADQDDARFGASESIIMEKINSALCTPLICQGETLGAIYLDSNSRFSSFTEDQQAMLTGIANQAAAAIRNARLHGRLVQQQKLEKEMEIAREIQVNLLPKEFPEIPNFELAAMSLSAKHVGGDYYDFAEMQDGRTTLSIADVSGKGVPAALLTTTMRAAMLSWSDDRAFTPAQMTAYLNRAAVRDSVENMFITMFYAILNGEERSLSYTNAGHAFPLLLRKNGNFDELNVGGCFLGIEESLQYDEATVTMEQGDVLVLYTDGVTDMSNEHNEQFGPERLRSLIKEKREDGAQDTLDAIYQATLEFRGTAPQFDDFTLIVCRCIS